MLYLKVTQVFKDMYEGTFDGTFELHFQTTKNGDIVCPLVAATDFPTIFENQDFTLVNLTDNDFNGAV